MKIILKTMLFIFIVMFSITACDNDTSVVIKHKIPDRGFLMGTLPIPSTDQSFDDAYDLMAEWIDFVPVWGRPSPFYDMPSELSGDWGDIFLRKSVIDKNLTPLITFHLSMRDLFLWSPKGWRKLLLAVMCGGKDIRRLYWM